MQSRHWARERPCKLLISRYYKVFLFCIPNFGHLLVTIFDDTLSCDIFFYIDLCCHGIAFIVVVKNTNYSPFINNVSGIIIRTRDKRRFVSLSALLMALGESEPN